MDGREEKEMIWSVWEWLGISKEEFLKKVKFGTCVKCGKPSKTRADSLCLGHSRAFHRWANRQTKLEEGEFERRIMEKAKISAHHGYAYVIKTCEVMLLLREFREGFPNLFKDDIEDRMLSKEEFTNKLIKQNRERLNWFLKYLGGKK